MDVFLEARIRFAALLIRIGYAIAKSNCSRLSKLVSQRSPAAVERMEKRMGLQ